MASSPPRAPYAERLRAARARRHLTPQELSEQLGWGHAGLWDLEAYDDELPMCLSVDDVGKLCHTLQVDPAVLLAPDSTEAESAVPRMTPSEVVAQIKDHLAATGLSPEAFAEQVGWEITQILSDPNELWALNVDGLHDVCTGAHVNWLQALPPPA